MIKSEPSIENVRDAILSSFSETRKPSIPNAFNDPELKIYEKSEWQELESFECTGYSFYLLDREMLTYFFPGLLLKTMHHLKDDADTDAILVLARKAARNASDHLLPLTDKQVQAVRLFRIWAKCAGARWFYGYE